MSVQKLQARGCDPTTAANVMAAANKCKVSWADIETLLQAIERTGNSVNWTIVLKLFADLGSGNFAAVLADFVALFGGAPPIPGPTPAPVPAP